MSAAAGTLDRRDAIDMAAVAFMLALTFSWGLNGVAAKLANVGFNPIFLTLARSAIGGFLVFLWCRYRGISLFTADGTLRAGLLAGFLFGCEFTLIFVGLEYTTVARSTLMINTMPFWVLIGAHFLLGEHMSLAKFGGLALAFAGVVLVFSDKLSLPNPSAIIGDVMSIGAGMFWAATTLVIKRSRLVTASAEKLLLYQLSVSAVMALPMLLFAGPVFREVSAVPVAALLFQAIYVVAVTYVLWFWLMRRYPAAGLSSFAFLTPVFGVLCGGLLLKEPLSIRIFLALALIGAGLIIVNRTQPQRTYDLVMRDILSDLEAGKQLSDPDPVRRAQIQMRAPVVKRFYETATVEPAAEGFSVKLDGKQVKTPMGKPVVLPAQEAAALVAAEFAAQVEKIDPVTMPVTRLVNTAIDGVATDTQAVLEDVLRFSSSDLVFYRADSPDGLVQQQAEAWDPIIDWARSALGARFFLAEGVMHVEQPREAIAAVGVHLRQREEPFRLAALHVITSITGSALLALAFEAGAIDAEAVWSAAHVDEDWNIAHWGLDEEAAARRAFRKRDMMGAAALIEALG